MGTLHTVRYRQPQTYQVYQKDHNGLLTHIGSPGGCLPHGPVLRLLLRRLPGVRLRSGRRLRWIRWIRFGLVGSWTGLRISRTWSWLWLRIGGYGLGLGVGIAPAIGIAPVGMGIGIG